MLGIDRLVLKAGSDNSRSSIHRIMKRITAKGVEVTVGNRSTLDLDDVLSKVYNHDLFGQE